MENDIYLTPDDNLEIALQKCPENAFVHLAPGIYRQKTKITTPGLTILGAGAQKTRLVFDDYARKRMPDGFEYITFRSYTCAVCADNITMCNLSIANDAGSPEKKGQQIALSVYGDHFRMKNCTLRSTQDTLFLGPLPDDLIERYTGFLSDDLRQDRPLRQSFSLCIIEGTVDFLFGCGEALFEDCELRSLRDARHMGYAAAPAHGYDQTDGFTFRNCRFTCEDGVTPGSIYLARPWRDYGLCRFEGCTYGAHISPLGFDKWGESQRDKTARFYETPKIPGRVDWAK